MCPFKFVTLVVLLSFAQSNYGCNSHYSENYLSVGERQKAFGFTTQDFKLLKQHTTVPILHAEKRSKRSSPLSQDEVMETLAAIKASEWFRSALTTNLRDALGLEKPLK